MQFLQICQLHIHGFMLLVPNSAPTICMPVSVFEIHQTRLCFSRLQLSSFGEPVSTAASAFCCWLAEVEPKVRHVHSEMIFCSPQLYRTVIWVTVAFLSAGTRLAILCWPLTVTSCASVSWFTGFFVSMCFLYLYSVPHFSFSLLCVYTPPPPNHICISSVVVISPALSSHLQSCVVLSCFCSTAYLPMSVHVQPFTLLFSCPLDFCLFLDLALPPPHFSGCLDFDRCLDLTVILP